METTHYQIAIDGQINSRIAQHATQRHIKVVTIAATYCTRSYLVGTHDALVAFLQLARLAFGFHTYTIENIIPFVNTIELYL